MIHKTALLNFKRYPADISLNDLSKQTPLVIAHGLFGSNANWRSFAQKASAKRPVIVIDQRNHGQSPQLDSHTYEDMANDLLALCDHLSLEKIDLCGHSMGGKMAMVFALLHPSRIDRLIVLDIAPVSYSHSHAPFLEALMGIDLSVLTSRSQADKVLAQAIPDTATRLFLLLSLQGSPGRYHWRINLPVLNQFMPEITDFPINDEFEFETRADNENQAISHKLEPSKAATLFVYAQNSDYLLQKHHEFINDLFLHAAYVEIAQAGHWLHVEQPELVLKAIENFLEDQ